jgi:riboflavin biosynthesis pyrimidine reductase
MRVLVGPETEDLGTLYAVPRTPWFRLNFVSTVDGAAQGKDGKSGGINNAADKAVFDTLRGLADAVVVGAGTARVEGYRPAAVPIVVVTRSGAVPRLLRGADPGRVLAVTCAASPGLDDARAVLGDAHVIVLGDDAVDLGALPGALAGRGLPNVLCEGGPHLARDLFAAGVVDELCATTVPRLLAGAALGITDGDGIDVPLRLHVLLEDDGTLLARWLVARP